MVAVTTVLFIALLVLSWRSRAWLVAVLGIAVGVTLTGPIADMVQGSVNGVQTAVTTVDQVVRDGKK
jgi:predicted branched-subunit amino acid permease